MHRRPVHRGLRRMPRKRARDRVGVLPEWQLYKETIKGTISAGSVHVKTFFSHDYVGRPTYEVSFRALDLTMQISQREYRSNRLERHGGSDGKTVRVRMKPWQSSPRPILAITQDGELVGYARLVNGRYEFEIDKACAGPIRSGEIQLKFQLDQSERPTGLILTQSPPISWA